MSTGIINAAKEGILQGQLKVLQAFLDDEDIRDISATAIRAILCTTQDLAATLHTICPQIGPRLSSEEAFGTFIDLVGTLWNALPPEERGASPETDDLEPGPIESMLIEKYVQYIQTTVDPTQFGQQEEINTAVNEATSRWLTTPYDDLNGKMPKEAVADERRSVGRKDLEWSIILHIHVVQGSEK